jgi:hypothetical protein
LFGGTIQIVTLVLFGFVLLFVPDPWKGYISIFFVLCYFFGFNNGIGSVLFLLINEMPFDGEVSGFVRGFLVSLNYLLSAVTTGYFL